MRRFPLSVTSAVFLAALALVPPAAADEADGLDGGKVDVKMVAVKDSSTPMVVVRAIVDSPPAKVWAVVSDCAHYKERLPRIAASRLVKKEGNKHTCEVTLAMPFPLSNLTAVTEAVHEESDKGMTRRWKMVSGDYKFNTGSWEVKPHKGGAASLVTYKVHAEPNSAVPDFIKEMAQKKSLPEMIARVREEAAKIK